MRLKLLRHAGIRPSAESLPHHNAAGSARTARERLLHTLASERRQRRLADADAPLLLHLLNQDPGEGATV